jgi:hypothetical protein
MNKPQIEMPGERFFRAAVIARAAGCCARTIKRRAVSGGWPRHKRGNAFTIQPPHELLAKCLKNPRQTALDGLRDLIIPPARRAEIFRAEKRFQAICSLELALQSGEPIERALRNVARDFTFSVSTRSLRSWHHRFFSEGFAGLLEKKLGRSGRKPKEKR